MCIRDRSTWVAVATGDAVICSRCKGIFNFYSTLTKDSADDKQVWQCEFCGNPNEVQLEEEELPKVDQLTYVLQSAQQVMEKKEGGEDITLMFCIDVSGSMCVTQPIEGRMALKYDKLKKLQTLKKFGNGSQQYTQGERANQTYVSRMQCVQTAIESQLKGLSSGAPKRKVGIVTFSNDVALIGDGTLPPKVYAGDKLTNFEGLLEASQKDADAYMTKPIEATQADLIKGLERIEESGQTALGPGLVVALGAALKGIPGSRVIICTDGLANVGIGSIENLENEKTAKETEEFYKKVGELARAKGVSISIVSIVSEECNLEMLSPLADLTGGDIIKVNPMNLSSDFASILSESIVATNVELRMKLHKGLTFRNENPAQISEDGSLLVKPIGNATEGQEVTVEYCAKSEEELKKMSDVDFTKVKELSFQVQISYDSLAGAKCVRLITKKLGITFEKEHAKKSANYEVISINAIQKSAKLAQKGDYRAAQANAVHWQKMIKGSEHYDNFLTNVKPLYNALEKQQNEDVQKSKVGKFEFSKAKSNDATVHLVNQATRISSKKMKKK
eukprot:TRINITY_DN2488_c0_g2_i3.p1 TRINITY_DN2488_c0_g2~~TRINITY_DN2488_c0_g2_i3.p1  ORF type:complete len:562 (+),score=186.15 TRINITY_DN2488_c0_g2_i3:80-1765(+)